MTKLDWRVTYKDVFGNICTTNIHATSRLCVFGIFPEVYPNCTLIYIHDF